MSRDTTNVPQKRGRGGSSTTAPVGVPGQGVRDVTAALHLASALEQHRRRVERDGGAVPELISLLERLARFRVSAGQDGSTFGDSAGPLDDQSVTPRLLTLQQVGDALAVSESTVKRLIASGELKSVHIGSRTLVRLEDVDVFVASLPAGRVSA